MTALYVAPRYNPRVIEEAAVVHFVSPQAYAARAAVIARGHLKAIEQAASTAGVACEPIHAFNDYPYEEILRTARRKKCDLIYMASHGRRGISRLLLGSRPARCWAQARFR